ncbi:hypothetical protein OsJ_10442 [Oryza sativa Japonica Group]|uniref:Fe2OG dioxygenase domain-containing protein n=1 Tax=Oryza sativa subsp. japonica TaxID=39947 RepID=B9F7R6_ORYSJ|nr:hypothetical protein OsJ_10442 [Oryza sativa Japonica Group]
MSSCFNGGAGWPEPVVRVQAVSDSCGATIPERYVKAPSERPSSLDGGGGLNNIPVVDMSMPDGEETARAVAAACREWGFFQAVNHGVRPELLRRAHAAWRGFFARPRGGPRGVRQLAGDVRGSHDKWPTSSVPAGGGGLREATEEYAEEVVRLCRRVMRLLSRGLGLDDGRLQAAFGGVGGEGACLRVNFYPRCPQPELTLGVASHSDPGGMTMLLVDDHVRGLQVKNAGHWITVDPVPDAFIVNIGDQIQVLSNAVYKSVEHRVTVSAAEERLSLAFFYNPRSDLPLAPMPELCGAAGPPGALPADDLRRVPRAHPAVRPQRQGAAPVSADGNRHLRRPSRRYCVFFFFLLSEQSSSLASYSLCAKKIAYIRMEYNLGQ